MSGHRHDRAGPVVGQHVVGRVHATWGSANTDPQATEGAAAQARDDVAQAVVPAVAATLPGTRFAQRQVQIVVDDEQAFGRGTPALDGLQHELAAVIHEASGQHEARTAQRHGHQAWCRAQSHARDRFSDRARSDVVPRAQILPLGVPEPDDHPRRGIAGRELVRGHCEEAISYQQSAVSKKRGPPQHWDGSSLLMVVFSRQRRTADR